MNFVKGILLGFTGAGKTSFIAKNNNDDVKNLNSTPNAISINFNVQIPENNDNYMFQIWDTAGQEEYRSLTKSLYNNTQIVFIFTVATEDTSTEEKSYILSQYDESMKFYIKEAQDSIQDEFKFVFLINKVDLLDESLYDQRKEEVIEKIKEVIPDFKDEVHFVSCFSGYNCESVFKESFKEGLKLVPKGNRGFQIQPENQGQPKKEDQSKKCCNIY